MGQAGGAAALYRRWKRWTSTPSQHRRRSHESAARLQAPALIVLGAVIAGLTAAYELYSSATNAKCSRHACARAAVHARSGRGSRRGAKRRPRLTVKCATSMKACNFTGSDAGSRHRSTTLALLP